jgi:hypothetical protein
VRPSRAMRGLVPEMNQPAQQGAGFLPENWPLASAGCWLGLQQFCVGCRFPLQAAAARGAGRRRRRRRARRRRPQLPPALAAGAAGATAAAGRGARGGSPARKGHQRQDGNQLEPPRLTAVTTAGGSPSLPRRRCSLLSASQQLSESQSQRSSASHRPGRAPRAHHPRQPPTNLWRKPGDLAYVTSLQQQRCRCPGMSSRPR